VVDGDIPVTAIYASASVHDSSLALPVIKESSSKVTYLYDLADAACNADTIEAFSRQHHHEPVIDINPKNSKRLKENIEGEKKLIELGFRTKKTQSL